MSKSCVVLVMLCAWQACRAQELVNLVWPHISQTAPQGWPDLTWDWKLFDHDKSTFETVLKGGYPGGVRLELQQPHTIRPTHYRIIMAAHVPSADYPSSWKVTAKEYDIFRDIKLDQVTGAVFKDRVYEGTLRKQIDMTHFLVQFDQKRVTIAEVELLGPRSALDALWPYGKYPCSQRLAVITSARGPERIFSRSKNFVSQEDLRVVFKANLKWSADATFYFDGAKPVLIGAKLPSLPMVQEVWIDAANLHDVRVGGGVEKVVLQGNLCENDHCHKLGSKGWVKLGVGTQIGCCGSINGPLISVKNPGEYKAYRLKFIPRTGHPRKPDGVSVDVRGISFLGCTA